MAFEEWKEINNNYSVSSLGRVRSIATGKEVFLKPSTSGNRGYEIVTLRIKGKSSYRSVHRLVGEYFLGLKESQVINHKDKDITNNMLYNLEACSHRHNMKHIHEHRRRYVSPNKDRTKFKVGIRHSGDVHWYGTYSDKEEAYEVAYNQYFKIFNKYPWSK